MSGPKVCPRCWWRWTGITVCRWLSNGMGAVLFTALFVFMSIWFTEFFDDQFGTYSDTRTEVLGMLVTAVIAVLYIGLMVAGMQNRKVTCSKGSCGEVS